MLAISGVVWLAMSSNGLDFNKAHNAVKSGNESKYYLEVVQNNEVLYEIPMTAYGTYTIKNKYTKGENSFVIDTNGAHMDSANCRDKVCVHEGNIAPEILSRSRACRICFPCKSLRIPPYRAILTSQVRTMMQLRRAKKRKKYETAGQTDV